MERDNTFSVTPMNQMIKLQPGEVFLTSITVVNSVNSAGEFSYKAYVVPYNVLSGEYDVDVTTMTGRTQLVDWVTILNPTGTLAPNETAEVELEIQVPENVAAGGQYAAIVVGVDDEKSRTQSGTTIRNVKEIASVIYANVEGETVHGGRVLENNIPGFAATVPVKVEAMIENTGNTHEVAEVTIAASNLLTGETVLPTEFDDGKYSEIVMPETTKFVTREINGLPMLGIVKISQSIYYNYAISTEEKVVVICPIWFMVLVVVTLMAVIAKVVGVVQKHKKAGGCRRAV